uniref:Peptidase S1 domain-containing protein n=2 Tax=Parascaris TaxID=6254 RepID=A0A915B1C3_PARUN
MYRIRLGGHVIGTGEEHYIRNITIHPFFNVITPSSYDIALVRIEPPAKPSDKVRLVCLPILPVADNRICVVTGWGHEKEGGLRAPALREIHVPILSPFICNDAQHYFGRLHFPSMLCAGYSKGGIDACQGDSGGPLVCEMGGRWELQGLVSWGNGCGRPGNPGVYTRIVELVPWINFNMMLLR